MITLTIEITADTVNLARHALEEIAGRLKEGTLSAQRFSTGFRYEYDTQGQEKPKDDET